MNRGGRAAASGSEREEFGWRNTPKINLVLERRTIPLSPGTALLLVVLLIVAAGAWIVYARLQDREAEVAAAAVLLEQARQRQRDALQELERARADAEEVEAEVRAVDAHIEEIEKQDAGVIEVYTQLTRKRPEWAVTVQALLQTDSSEFHIDRLEARPPSKIDLSATVADPGSISRFRTYMNSVSDFLDLTSLNYTQSSATFEAVVDLK